jgi:uncharacterized protein YbjT (DUF2867 family)
MKENILVIGGTGKTGRRVVASLQSLGHNVRIGSRSQTPAFDWNDPTTYAAVLDGMDKAYVVYSPDLAVPGAKEAIQALTAAAKKAQLKKVILLSGKGEQEAEASERIVAASGLNYTLVRASWFNQNFTESFLLEPVLSGHVALPMPHAAIPFVDADDIAEVVVEALLNDELDKQTLEVTGPEKISFESVVQEIAAATGRDIAYQPISLEDFGQGLRNANLPDDYVWLLEYLFREVLGNDENQTISSDFERVTGKRSTSFREFARKVAPSGVWSPQIISPA